VATLTTPARSEEDASPRPLPWRRMAWVTWRQHWAALGGVAALLSVLTLWLWVTGLQVHHSYAAAAACQPASSLACTSLIGDFNSTYGRLAVATAALLQVVPALIGAFAGAPVLARELETGTFRFAWTLAFGRWRWTLAKLVPLAVAVAAAAGMFSALLSWYFQPFFADGNLSPLAGTVFDLRGAAFAAWTLAAFAIGVLAGVLIRRVVPAITATLAAYAGLAVAADFLRQHYAGPLLTSNLNLPGSAWIISQWWTKGGKAGNPPPSICTPCELGAGAGKPSPGSINQCLVQHGYTQWTSYQPGSRFWPFQWIEGGWLFALSLLLIAATIWLVRHRAA
jgi:hypothetical protein